MANLPEDAVINILLRLPTKSLARFRYVSHYWHSIITDSQFVNKHLKRVTQNNNDNLCLMLGNYMEGDSSVYSLNCNEFFVNEAQTEFEAKELSCSFKSSEHDSDFSIIASCNGLLLCELDDGDVFLWNPCTNASNQIPLPPRIHALDFGRARMGCTLYGFGYDPWLEDYKVLRIVQFVNPHGRDDSQIKLYTLGTGTWRTIKGSHINQWAAFFVPHSTRRSECLNGVIHWKCDAPGSPPQIIGFDLLEQEFHEVPQPDYDYQNYPISLGVLGDCLRIANNFSDEKVDVWVMTSYGVKESWTKIFTVSLTLFVYLKPLCFSATGTGEVLMTQNSDGELVVYDPEHAQVTRTLKICGIPDDPYVRNTYVETLVSPKSGTREMNQEEEAYARWDLDDDSDCEREVIPLERFDLRSIF